MSDLEILHNSLIPKKNDDLLQQHLYKQIIQTDQASEENPEVSRLVTNARLLKANKEYGLSLGLVAEALRLDSYSSSALRFLIDYHADLNDRSAEVRSCKALVSIDYCFENLVRLGLALYTNGQDDDSKKVFEEALEIQTLNSDLSFEMFKTLGNILVKSGDFEGAEEFYNKAFNICPGSDVLTVNLGTLAVQRGDYEDAKNKFRMALEMNPKNDKAWIGLAIVHNYFGDHAIATANLENALDSNPGNRTGIQLAAQWFLRDQRLDSAIFRLQAFLETVENDREITLLLIHFYCLKKDFILAKFELERALLFEPQNEALLEVEIELCKMI